MTVGHLLFAATATGYILAGIAFEEHDLIQSLGDTYAAYRAREPALIPRPSRGVLRPGLSETKKRQEAGDMDSRTVITPAAWAAQAGGNATWA